MTDLTKPVVQDQGFVRYRVKNRLASDSNPRQISDLLRAGRQNK